MKKMRDVLTENEAVSILMRNGIKLQFPKILLPKEGPGLKLWTAIDCLVNKHRYTLMPRGTK